ncbi:YbdK family carboxylate-amine ligase [Streptomyces nitrosporeus]|uniref:Putative glutamate--cysteine ligase 2 n=1 Tax=Streptomyces nitrosporeus TaxID=28894 RepID=A0A5J6F377_9ACTN|nr:YbdK family carboxylate-amine ligase [Streptomyces nitrosporeus]
MGVAARASAAGEDHGRDGPTFGVEEEFLLVDPVTLLPVPAGPDVLARAGRTADGEPGAGGVGSALHLEMWADMVEAATPVCTRLSELGHHLLSARLRLARAARDEGVRLASVGHPVTRSGPPRVNAGEHYERMRHAYAAVVTGDEVCGCHVHVGVPDREHGVAVINSITPWLPVLLALTASSPFRQGVDTGFHSWRTVVFLGYPGAGLPPYWPDVRAYDDDVSRLLDCGLIPPGGTSLRLVRLSPRFPTVEVRIGDAATTVDEAVLYAALVRALVHTALSDLAAGRAAGPVDPSVLADSLWAAARNGLRHGAVDPWKARPVPAHVMLAALLKRVRPALEELGDLGTVRALLERLRVTGPAPARQRRAAAAGGVQAVLELVLDETVSGTRVPFRGTGMDTAPVDAPAAGHGPALSGSEQS